jgi:hypothetical protein
MAEYVLALTPINSQGGAILTFVFPMLLFLVIAAILWALFAGWDWPISRRFRPSWVRHFQTAIAKAGPDTVPAPAATARATAADAPGAGAPESDTAQEGQAGQGPGDEGSA